MIALVNKFTAFPSGMFDLNISQDGRFGWFLLTWHPETDPVLEEIQTQIKLDIRSSALGQTSKAEIENWLRNFFTEYHWKLHAVFRKTNLKEKGISLFLAVMFDQELYVLEFGRMLCGLVDKSGVHSRGRSWSNFHVKSLDEMNLLGLLEADVSVKPFRLLVPENQSFLALPSVFSEQLLNHEIDYATFDTLVQSYVTETNGCYFLLEGKSKLKVKKRRRLRKYQLSAIIVIILAIIAFLYMRYGNRWLESTGRKIKLLLTSKSRLTVEQLPQYLNIQSQNLQKQLEKIENLANQPAREIKLVESWQTDLDFLVTAAPSFDISNIYIVSENKLLAFNKASKKLEWTKEFNSDISKVTVIRGNLIVFLENLQMLCLKNGETISWEETTNDRIPSRATLTPFEINSEDDPRINNSILVVPIENGLDVYDVNSGKLLSDIQFEKHMQYLSQYDAFDNCFYAVVADGIYCISLDILN